MSKHQTSGPSQNQRWSARITLPTISKGCGDRVVSIEGRRRVELLVPSDRGVDRGSLAVCFCRAGGLATRQRGDIPGLPRGRCSWGGARPAAA
jgi:hypothetical protein